MVNSAPGLKLQAVRDALLTLHKTLLESERIGYEQAFGPIPSPGHYLRLVTTDSWFAWLRPLSRLIVALDEVLDAPEPPPPDTVRDLVLQVRRLLVVSEEGDGFPRSYFEALQRDPDVVLAHADVVALVRSGVQFP